MPAMLKLVELPGGRHIMESTPRYEIQRGGQRCAEVFFNMTGFVVTPGLPLPNGRDIQLPESSLSRLRRYIAVINAVWRQAVTPAIGKPRTALANHVSAGALLEQL